MTNKSLTYQKWKAFVADPAKLFVLQVFLVYASWKVFHYIMHLPGTPVFGIWESITFYLGHIYAIIVSRMLNLFGQQTFVDRIFVVYTKDHNWVEVAEHCLAIPAAVLFTFSILLFKGGWKDKLWFIPLGLAGIIVINTLRLIFVCTTFEYFSSTFFKINHSIVYVIITYALIFTMIAWWLKRNTNTPKMPN